MGTALALDRVRVVAGLGERDLQVRQLGQERGTLEPLHQTAIVFSTSSSASRTPSSSSLGLEVLADRRGQLLLVARLEQRLARRRLRALAGFGFLRRRGLERKRTGGDHERKGGHPGGEEHGCEVSESDHGRRGESGPGGSRQDHRIRPAAGNQKRRLGNSSRSGAKRREPLRDRLPGLRASGSRVSAHPRRDQGPGGFASAWARKPARAGASRPDCRSRRARLSGASTDPRRTARPRRERATPKRPSPMAISAQWFHSSAGDGLRSDLLAQNALGSSGSPSRPGACRG